MKASGLYIRCFLLLLILASSVEDVPYRTIKKESLIPQKQYRINDLTKLPAIEKENVDNNTISENGNDLETEDVSDQTISVVEKQVQKPVQNFLHTSGSFKEKYPGFKLTQTIATNNLKDLQSDKYWDESLTFAGSPVYTITGEKPSLRTDINKKRALTMGAIVISSTYLLHQKQAVAWWDGKERNFHIKEDWDNALFADKFGHFIGGYFWSYVGREALLYTGVSWEKSILYGSLIGLTAQTYVEIKDGYAENTGFSPSDMAADIGGVVFFYLQHRNEFLQNFTPKWQYVPPSLIGVPEKAKTHVFLDNYNATTAWMSVNIRNLIWKDQDTFWPDWLNIAFGYGINGYYTPDKYGRYVIGLDLNLVELLPEGAPLWNWLRQSLNYIKLPAPAVEFTRHGTQFKLFYPLSLSPGSLKF